MLAVQYVARVLHFSTSSFSCFFFFAINSVSCFHFILTTIEDREIGDLYPFGSEEGDNLLPRGDHSSALINLPDAYPFNDKLETVLYVRCFIEL